MSEQKTEQELDKELERKRLETMQERIAWLELNLEQAQFKILDLQEAVDRLSRQMRYLATMQQQSAEAEAVRPLSEETPPPHY